MSLGNSVQRSSGRVGVAVPGFRLGRLMSVAALTVAVAGCGPLSEDLGIHQVWVSHIAMPDSIVSTDTLVADLSGGTEVGDCLSLSHVAARLGWSGDYDMGRGTSVAWLWSATSLWHGRLPIRGSAAVHARVVLYHCQSARQFGDGGQPTGCRLTAVAA